MGWKASCILINERGPGYLGTMPTHDTERARRLIADFGLGPCRSRGMTNLLENLHPVDLIVGAYDGAAIIGAPEVVGSCFAPADEGRSPADDPLLGRILRAYPSASILCIVLHSVVDLFGYAYYQGGSLIRAFGGADGDPVLMDVGDWQREEQPLFRKVHRARWSEVLPGRNRGGGRRGRCPHGRCQSGLRDDEEVLRLPPQRGS